MSETNPKTNNNKHQQQQQQSSESSSNGKIKVRCIVQQCTNAKLQTKLEDKENAIRAEHVQVFIKIKNNFFKLLNDFE